MPETIGIEKLRKQRIRGTKSGQTVIVLRKINERGSKKTSQLSKSNENVSPKP